MTGVNWRGPRHGTGFRGLGEVEGVVGDVSVKRKGKKETAGWSRRKVKLWKLTFPQNTIYII